MKKILNKSKNTFFQLLLLCFVFTLMSAFIPFNFNNSIAGSTDEGVGSITNNYEGPGMLGLSMIDCPGDTVLNISIGSCTASGELSLPSNIEGLCGGNEFNAETFEGGILNVMGSLEDGDLTILAQDFAPGTHHVQYMVTDSCDNVFECEFEVVVPPASAVVVLKQNVVVALAPSSTSGNAMTTLYPLDIDNGSHNPCSSIKLEIRRETDLCDIPGNATYNADGHPNDGDPDPNSANYDPDEGESVKFCCEDLTNMLYDVDGDGMNDIGYIKVWMRVWDDTNLDGIPGNEDDSYVEAWTFVKVVDQLAPAIVCPPDITLKCNEDFQNPDVTGWAEGYASCGSVPVEYTDIIINISACNVGFIRKRWNIVGASNIFCDQTITVEDLDGPVTVTFPPDYSTANCPDDIVIDDPTWIAGPCDVLGYTVETDSFYFEDGACIKLVNHLTVINWCDYEPNNPNWDGEGLWEHTQIIKVIDETKPILEDCEDKLFAVNDHDDIDNDGEVCETMITLTNVATDPGSENCPSDWLKWQVFVDLWADGTNDLEYSSFLPYFDDQFNDTNGNGIPDIYLNSTISGEEVSIQLPDIVGALSHHKVTWKVTDGCNNVTTCETEYLVTDQTSPTVACQDTITVGLASMAPSTLWAINYISEVMDNCSSNEDLRFTFSASPPEDDPSYDPDRRSSSYVLNLNDIANGFVEFPIYIWDENGNFTFCETVFIIDPTMILDTEEAAEIHTNALHQNQPNPFRLSTSVSFNLHRDTPVKLTFINAVSAKTLEIEVAGKKGLNTYALDSDLLSGQGLYYYTMTTKYYQETKKMILVY